MIDMLKHYTLEQLQETDIDLLFPLYNWYCKVKEKTCGENPQVYDNDIVYRDGRAYRKVNPKKASWIYN